MSAQITALSQERRFDQIKDIQTAQADAARLCEISTALNKVGSLLDAADRMGHSPWKEISRLETEITDLTGRLSERFIRSYPKLILRLLDCGDLHLRWADLRDEVEQVLHLASTSGIVYTTSSDAEMRTAIREAQRSLDRFIAMLASPQEGQTYFGIKARLPIESAPGEHEHIWLSEVSYAENRFQARIANDSLSAGGPRTGDEIEVDRKDVTDWMVIEDGVMLGGYTVRVIRTE